VNPALCRPKINKGVEVRASPLQQYTPRPIKNHLKKMFFKGAIDTLVELKRSLCWLHFGSLLGHKVDKNNKFVSQD
jgi:hypothetical protein